MTSCVILQAVEKRTDFLLTEFVRSVASLSSFVLTLYFFQILPTRCELVLSVDDEKLTHPKLSRRNSLGTGKGWLECR